MSKSLLDGPDPIPDGPDYADRALASLEGIELVAEDGEPMDSGWHRKCMNLLIEQIEHHFRGRPDFYVGGNMFIYFSTTQAKNRDFRGPDFFFVGGRTSRHPIREYWALWDEGNRAPDVVIELASPTTVEEDRGPKLEVYRDVLRVGNYFVYDRTDGRLDGWRLERHRYVPIPPAGNGRVYSDELDLWLGPWDGEYLGDGGTWLRFYDVAGAVVPLPAEAAEQRAVTAEQRAEAERRRAESEKQRADASDAELARLKEQLARLQPPAPEKPV